MAIQLKHSASCLCNILLLLSIISFSNAKKESCTCCPYSDQDRRSNHTLDLEDARFAFHLIDADSESVRVVGLDFFHNLSDSDANSTGALGTIGRGIQLWQERPGWLGLGVDEASFSISIGYEPLPEQRRSGLAFLILPPSALSDLDAYDGASSSLAKELLASYARPLNVSNHTFRSAFVSGRYVIVTIGVLVDNPRNLYGSILVVNITINPAPVPSAASNYAVWINYDHVGHRLSVYVDLEGKPQPDNTIAEVQLTISSVVPSRIFFGLLSTVAQLLRTRDANFTATVDDLPYYHPDKGGFLSRKVTILSSVLGSIAVTVLVAAAVACYFNSRYRRWHRDLDQLARSMECLPGVPKKIDFADINKATGNFHEAMKLGAGGFGAVYRCTLPAVASKTERPTDVAVKRFTRDVQNGRYDDFLAEVSIINRLRHKNIVPLVGWSYNKGEPLLVFEYMTNGSLDQHLFPKGGTGSGSGKRCTDAVIRRWATRYEIIMDIATGLHYVHHEYEPMVLHRDIKASNVMLDSRLRARLGDFGLACTVDVDRNSATGVAGTWGYIAPEYAVCRKATRQTDIYALGVLILEVVTGQRALASHKVFADDDIHISDRVWRLHHEGRLPECVDASLIIPPSLEEAEQRDVGGDAERLLLLGLACSNPNPSDRPTMPEVVRVVAKLAPPPQVPPQKPRFVWPPQDDGHSVDSYDDSICTSMMSYLDKSTRTMDEVQSHVGSG